MAKLRRWGLALLVLYLLVLLRITVFRSGWTTNSLFGGSLVLIPFQTIFSYLFHGNVRYFLYLFLGNLFWFVPLGVFLRRCGLRFGRACLLGLLLSALIETAQFVLSTGTSETEDVLLNTVGTMLGFGAMQWIAHWPLPNRNAKRVISALTGAEMTLVTAESCTGGLLGKLLTDVPGASRAYRGGVVSYAYALKESLLGVDPALLADSGAVCAAVAEQMARGAQQRLGADFALSVTGNAGPGTDAKNPTVGEIFIACASAQDCVCRRLLLRGGRRENRLAACDAALELLLSVCPGAGHSAAKPQPRQIQQHRVDQ